MANYVITVNGEEIALSSADVDVLDSIKVDDTHLHVLENHTAYEVAVVASDFGKKTVQLLVNGRRYDLRIADEYDLQVDKMGLLTTTTAQLNHIEAPMPGLIVEVLVELGQEILKGTPLLVLSAMKMENIILSPGEGTVQSITISNGDTVEKGQLLLELN